MKKLLGTALIIGVLTCVGCVTTTPDKMHPVSTAAVETAKPAPPPVTPDQVTPATAHRIAQALAEEMDRDKQEP